MNEGLRMRYGSSRTVNLGDEDSATIDFSVELTVKHPTDEIMQLLETGVRDQVNRVIESEERNLREKIDA
jgi:hypothetical protein